MLYREGSGTSRASRRQLWVPARRPTYRVPSTSHWRVYAVTTRETLFIGFLPAISPQATKAIRRTIRQWRLHCWHNVALVDVAQEINPVLRGWVNYYGRFQRSALHTVFDPLDRYLERWLRRKYKRLKYKVSRAREMLRQIRRHKPALFAHWALAAHGWQ